MWFIVYSKNVFLRQKYDFRLGYCRVYECWVEVTEVCVDDVVSTTFSSATSRSLLSETNKKYT